MTKLCFLEPERGTIKQLRRRAACRAAAPEVPFTPREMKTMVTVSLLILAFVLQCFSEADTVHIHLRDCCPGVKRTCVNESSVKTVTRSSCGAKGIIVETKEAKGKEARKLCLDANWDWAQTLLEKFTSQDPKAKQMRLDYSQCQWKKTKTPAVSQHPPSIRPPVHPPARPQPPQPE